MGSAAQKVGKAQRRDDLARRDKLGPSQVSALKKLRAGAKAVGSFLSSGGKGGLDPGLVKHVMERDEFRCKVCGELGDKENGGIGVHHVGGIVTSKKTSRAGHASKPSNLISICRKCHDKLHTEAREEGIDSSQVTPERDKGTSRDHGLPDAHPDK